MKTINGVEIKHRDLGEWPVKDKTGQVCSAYRSHYRIEDKEIYTTVFANEIVATGSEGRLKLEIAQLARHGFIVDGNRIP